MNTPINQDFDAYKEDFYKGLSKRETKYGAMAFFSGIVIMFLMMFVLHANSLLATFVSAPVVIILGMNGFYTKNGMSFTELVKRKMELRKGIDYTISEVSVRDYRIKQMEEELRKQRAEEKKDKEKDKKKWRKQNKGNTRDYQLRYLQCQMHFRM